MPKGKEVSRSHVRSGVRSGRAQPAEKRHGRMKEPSACESCGAVFRNRAWRKRGRVTQALLDEASWVVCPACEQVRAETYLGRVLALGRVAVAEEEAIRRRVGGVERRQAVTQPQRRVVSIERTPDGLEILTTSPKLAHRITKELAKAWGGRATYAWSDDGSLLTRWRPPAVTARVRR
jgi:NMD protein affecting ribosome stability and mRNA decay